jgi:tyrosine-protein kinase Etk/Wzc
MTPSNHLRNPAGFESDDPFQDGTSPGHSRRFKLSRILLGLLVRWYWIALGLILGMLWASNYLSKAPRIYSSTATLLMQERVTVVNSDQIDAIDIRSIEGINTAAERIRSTDLLERVASRMDVRALPGLIPPAVDWRPGWLARWMDGDKKPEINKPETVPPAPALSGSLGSWMTVSIRGGTRLIDITFKHQVPEVAKALADAVAREYLADIISARTEGRSSQSDTLLKQSEEVRIKLQSAESALASYNRALELHKALEAQENLVSQLARRYKAKHPKMAAAESELDGLKSRFLDEFGVAMASPADITYWKSAGREFEQAQGDQESKLRLARQLLLARTGVLRGEITSQMSVFNLMITRLEESNANRAGEDTGVEISFARVAGGPSEPNSNAIYKTGATTGIAAGLALAFLLILLNNKIHSVAQAETETGHPVLAAIPNIDIGHLNRAMRRHTGKYKHTESNPLQNAWDPRLLFRAGINTTTYAEAFRILRGSISLLGDETKRKITLFSSALPGEGKSFVASNFALATASKVNRTLLIDFDLRKPSIHRVFGFSRSKLGPGVTEWLAAQCSLDEAVVRDTGAENLHIMFCGKRAPNPGELLNSGHLHRLFAKAREQYDCIVVDSSPLLAVPDARVIATAADNFCLVVRADYVPRGAVFRTLEMLDFAETRPSGIVFNGFKESRSMIGENFTYGNYSLNYKGKPYKYGYGSYGSYGAYGSEDDEDDEDDSDRKIHKRRSRKTSASDPES